VATPAAVFFDLDGTLTDPQAGIVGCIRYAFEWLGIGLPADDDLTWCIGPPLLDSLAELLRARANGMRCIGVLYGYGGDDELRAAGADQIVATPRQIAEALASPLFQGRS